MKLSIHAKKRMEERTDINFKNYKAFFIGALRHGKSAGHLKDGKLKEYLLNKEATGNCKAKYYKGYVFIYSKNSHRLYTMYKLPDEFCK